MHRQLERCVFPYTTYTCDHDYSYLSRATRRLHYTVPTIPIVYACVLFAHEYVSRDIYNAMNTYARTSQTPQHKPTTHHMSTTLYQHMKDTQYD